MKTIYQLWHEYEIFEDGKYYDILTLFGVFSTYDKAKAVMEKYLFHPDFVDYPNDFNIDDCIIDQKGWSEGFTGYDD